MFNDAIDDLPQSEITDGFVGMDCTRNPQLLGPGQIADGKNLYCRGDGSIETRPGLKLNAAIVRATILQYGAAESPDLTILTAAYYDTPTFEATIVFTTQWAWVITGSGDDILATILTPTSPYVTARTDSVLVQIVDRLYYLDTFSRLNWLLYTAGVWTTGIVTTFSDASAMPNWAYISAQNFRLLALESTGYKIYASAVGSAIVAADWVKTENIQVGTGEGDPGRVLLATQGGYTTIINTRSAYQINTAAASVANWTSIQVSRNIGIVNARTAVVLGQETFFLARHGVVKLSALQDIVSIAPQDTLSYPIQDYIDRINWSASTAAFAVSWKDCYLLAIPLDSETIPTHFFCYHLNLGQWQTPWIFSGRAPTWANQPTPYTWLGFTGAIAVNFADSLDTMLIDNVGTLRRLEIATGYDYSPISFGVVAPYANLTGNNDLIVSWLRTRSFNHGTTAAKKQALIVEIEIEAFQINTLIDVLVLCDNQASVTAAPSGSTIGYIAQLTLAASGNVTRRQQLRGTFNSRALAPFYSASVELFCANYRFQVRSVKLVSFTDSPHYT